MGEIVKKPAVVDIEAVYSAGYDLRVSMSNELNEKIPLLLKIDPDSDSKNMIDFHKESGIPSLMMEMRKVIKIEARGVAG